MRRFRRFLLLLGLAFIMFHGYRTFQHVRRVVAYRPLVEEVLTDQGRNLDTDLVLAIIYTESKGVGQDIMQASESLTGVANSIQTPKESLEQGTLFLVNHLAEAKGLGVDEATAIQAYNFGASYLPYVAEKGGQSTVSLAKIYSREVVAPSLGNVTGQTYSYYHPIALMNGDMHLYYHGGNYYYAKEVAFNRFLIQLFGF